MNKLIIPVLALVMIACSILATPVPTPTATVVIPTPTRVPPTPLPTPTLKPYEQYTIDTLRRRSYGGGQIEVLDRISPLYFYHLINSAVQLHHGMDDSTAPISWAVETCNFLQSAGVSVQCVYYPDIGHVFNRSNLEKLQVSSLEFYRHSLLQ